MAEGILKTLGSIVGIGVGSLDLMLIKHAFQPGETVHGRLVLNLEEPVEAKRLVVGVHATEERWTTNTQGQRERETRPRYRVERQRAGKGICRGGGYDFQLPLPGAPDAQRPDGILADVVRLVAAVARPQLDWRVYAFLDIPWKANVKAGADITVG